jgi:aminomethyltransferase
MTSSPFAASFPASTSYETIGDASVPWTFTSVDEYAALRGASALLDLSGAGLIAVEGPDAEPFLSSLFTRDIEFLSPETSVMGMLLADDGIPLDVVTILRTDEGFLVETSIGCGSATFDHLQAHTGEHDVQVERRDGDTALLGFEGPASWVVAGDLLDEPITGLPFQGVRPVTIGGIETLISRTGFTGEFGFKISVDREHAVELWEKLAEHATPAGHAALEIAMTEIRQPIIHRELAGAEPGVISCGFNWLVDLEKEEFLGRDALLDARDSGDARLAVTFVSNAAALEAGAMVGADGEAMGEVVHVVRSPGLDAWCGIARVDADCAGSGLVFAVVGTDETVRTMSAPVRIPTSWGELITAQMEQG